MTKATVVLFRPALSFQDFQKLFTAAKQDGYQLPIAIGMWHELFPIRNMRGLLVETPVANNDNIKLHS